MVPSMAPAACAVKRQAACDTQSRLSTVNPSPRQRPFSLGAMRHLRRSPGLLRIHGQRHHCHCRLKNRRLNHRRRLHNSTTNARNTAGHHPSPDLVRLLPHHHWSHFLLPTSPPGSSHHSLLSIPQVRQQPHTPKRTKKGLTSQQVLSVRVRQERPSTTEASPVTRWVSARSLVPLPLRRGRMPPKLPAPRRKARRQTRCTQPFQKYRDRLPAAHQQYRLRHRPHPVRLSRLLLHRHHCSVRTMARRAAAARWALWLNPSRAPSQFALAAARLVTLIRPY